VHPLGSVEHALGTTGLRESLGLRHTKYVTKVWRKPIPVAVRSKAWVCSRSLAGIVDSNPDGGMDVCPCRCCVLSNWGLFVRPTPPSDEFYQMCVCVFHWVWSGATIPLHLQWLRRQKWRLQKKERMVWRKLYIITSSVICNHYIILLRLNQER